MVQKACRYLKVIFCHFNFKITPVLTIYEANLPQTENPTKRRDWKAINMEKIISFILANLENKYRMRLRGEISPNFVDDGINHHLRIVQQDYNESFKEPTFLRIVSS